MVLHYNVLTSPRFHFQSILGQSRLLHIPENRPGILTQINSIFADAGINIAAQYLQTNAEMGYVVIDIEAESF